MQSLMVCPAEPLGDSMPETVVQNLRKQIQDRGTAAHLLWHETREAMAFADANGSLRLVNDSFAEMLGYTVGELERMKWQDVTAGQDIDPNVVMFQQLVRGEIDSYSMVKSYTTKMRKTVTCRLVAKKAFGGVLVFGQVLPIDVLSLEQLPRDDRERVLRMMIGDFMFSRWKQLLVIVAGCITLFNFPELLKLLKLL